MQLELFSEGRWPSFVCQWLLLKSRSNFDSIVFYAEGILHTENANSFPRRKVSVGPKWTCLDEHFLNSSHFMNQNTECGRWAFFTFKCKEHGYDMQKVLLSYKFAWQSNESWNRDLHNRKHWQNLKGFVHQKCQFCLACLIPNCIFFSFSV